MRSGDVSRATSTTELATDMGVRGAGLLPLSTTTSLQLGPSLAPPMRAGGVEDQLARPAGLLRIEGSWRTGSRAAAS
eukprot:2321634-Pleurochrysis_carterae.AAC.1